MTQKDPTANSTSGPSQTGQPSSTNADDLQPHQDQHLIWMLNVIAEWLEYHASDATRADLAAFIGYPSTRGAILHVIDTAARWANELGRRRSRTSPATNRGDSPQPGAT